MEAMISFEEVWTGGGMSPPTVVTYVTIVLHFGKYTPMDSENAAHVRLIAKFISVVSNQLVRVLTI